MSDIIKIPEDSRKGTIEFSGDCVYNTQRHFTDCLITGGEFETNGREYLKSLAVQEAVYESAASNMYIKMSS